MARANDELDPSEDTPPFEIDPDDVNVETDQPDHEADAEDVEAAADLDGLDIELPDDSSGDSSDSAESEEE